MNLDALKRKLIVWMIRNHPGAYVRRKKLGSYRVARDTEFLQLHAELLEDNRGIQTLAERYNIYSLVKATSRLPGALAEAGVYRGGSAKVICKCKGQSPLYLFDTFEGLPKANQTMDGGFQEGGFGDTSRDDVAQYLAEFPEVHLYKGFFPDSAKGKEPETKTYRFVHLDLDLYESTLNALGFFYPRMTPGGVIVSHDYNCLGVPGVAKAFHEFFSTRPEPIVPLWDTQCVISKMGAAPELPR